MVHETIVGQFGLVYSPAQERNTPSLGKIN